MRLRTLMMASVKAVLVHSLTAIRLLLEEGKRISLIGQQVRGVVSVRDFAFTVAT